MSPEQLQDQDLDARSDLFSLGLVLYEMATGRPAFSGTTSAVIAAAILHEQAVPPRAHQPDLPARLEEIILKALEKDREDRYQTASDLRADLRRLKREIDSRPSSSPQPQGVSVPATEPQPAVPQSASSSDSQVVIALVKRHRVTVITAAALLVAAMAGGSYLGGLRLVRGTQDSALNSLQNVQVVPLTTSGKAWRPAISPDGKYVVYVQGEGAIGNGLWIRQTTNPSNVQIVATEPDVDLEGPTVTPDGNFVDFLRAQKNQGALWRVPFLGGTPKLVTDNIQSAVGWSHDGKHMAFVRWLLDGAGTALVVADSDGSGERVLARRKIPSAFFSYGFFGVEFARPAWSPDGRVIAVFGGSPLRHINWSLSTRLPDPNGPFHCEGPASFRAWRGLSRPRSS